MGTVRDGRGVRREFVLVALSFGASCQSEASHETSVGATHFAGVFAREAVAADHALASQAGAEMLRRGGNAVDAAVAASFCLSVVRPQSCGIGGGGFMVIHLPRHTRAGAVTTTLDYRETCPAAIDAEHYESRDADASRYGGDAVATPGTVAGLLTALEEFGTLDRAVVLAPAIRAAREGFEADDAYVSAARETAARFVEQPELQQRFPFLWERLLRRGTIAVGDRIENPEQARALESIAQRGRDGFYAGELAEAMLAAVRTDGGSLSREDLAGYAVRRAAPLRTQFRDVTLLGMPPPSSGGVVLGQCFTTLDAALRDEDVASPWSRDFTQLFVEAMKHGFADRARHLADPAFVELPLAELLDGGMLRRRARSLSRTRTLATDDYGWSAERGAASVPRDDGGTSHLSVVDASGGAVACTETINLTFGSWLEVPGFGFLMNDEMDDFTTRRSAPNAFGLRQSDANLPAPGKRPLSSMSPTIAIGADGAVLAVAGGSGGPRILSATAQALLSVLVFDLSAEAALARPRWHHQWKPDRLRHEPAMPEEALDAARARGHELEPMREIANVQLVRRARSGRGWEAASDPRKGGRPAGR